MFCAGSVGSMNLVLKFSFFFNILFIWKAELWKEEGKRQTETEISPGLVIQ